MAKDNGSDMTRADIPQPKPYKMKTDTITPTIDGWPGSRTETEKSKTRKGDRP